MGFPEAYSHSKLPKLVLVPCTCNVCTLIVRARPGQPLARPQITLPSFAARWAAVFGGFRRRFRHYPTTHYPYPTRLATALPKST